MNKKWYQDWEIRVLIGTASVDKDRMTKEIILPNSRNGVTHLTFVIEPGDPIDQALLALEAALDTLTQRDREANCAHQ